MIRQCSLANIIGDKSMKLLQSDQRTEHPELGKGYDETISERDMAYTLLSSRRRRNVLHALTQGGESTVSELSRQLAGWETGKPPEAVSSKERKRTYTALRQTHLPKLTKHGVIEYDANRGTVSLTTRGEEMRPYLYTPKGPVNVLFMTALAAILAGTTVLLLSWLGVPPFSLLTGYQLSVVTLTAFTLVTVAAYVQLGPKLGYQRAFHADTALGAKENAPAEKKHSTGDEE